MSRHHFFFFNMYKRVKQLFGSLQTVMCETISRPGPGTKGSHFVGFPVNRAIYLPYKHASDINLFSARKQRYPYFPKYHIILYGLDWIFII